MFKYSDKLIRSLIQGIYDGDIASDDLPISLYYAIADYLKKGLYKGFKPSINKSKGDLALLAELRENIYMFSAAKTYQQVKTMSELIIDDKGILRPFNEFKADAFEVFHEFNEVWLQTEYDTAVGMAQNAVKWQQIEEQKDILTVLRYSATDDENTCEICGPLDGMTAPVDDPVWDAIMPENHFRCRCLVEQLEEGKTTENKDALVEEVTGKMNPTFIMNPGKDKVIFSDKHPYFDVPKEDKGFARENFGLPVPDMIDPGVVKKLEEVEKKMEDLKITEDQKTALDYYIGSGYGRLNGVLRSGKEFESEYYRDMVESLSSFLKDAPKYDGQTYRGLHFTEKEFNVFKKQMVEGAEITDKGFMSTSASEEIVRGFMHGRGGEIYSAFIEIEGKNGVLIREFVDKSEQGEQEILFNKGSKFKIVSVTKGEFNVDIKLKEL